MSSTLGGWSLNHWTPREVPPLDILGHFSSNISPLPIFFFLRNAHYSFSFSAFSTSVLCVFALMVNLCLMPSERAAASGLPPASCPLSASTRSSVHSSRVSLSFQMQSIVRIRLSVMLASSFVFPVSSLLSLRMLVIFTYFKMTLFTYGCPGSLSLRGLVPSHGLLSSCSV